MRKVLLLLIFFFSIAVSAYGTDYPLADCDDATIQSKHDDMGTVAGDTLTLPSPCPGSTGSWTNGETVTITKGVIVRGSDCVADASGRVESTGTVLIDTHTNDGVALFSLNLAASQIGGVRCIQIDDGGTRSGGHGNVIIGVGDQSQNVGGAIGSRRFIINKMIFNQVKGMAPWVFAGYGVISGSQFNLTEGGSGNIPFYCAGQNFYDYADARWEEATDFTSDKAVYFENNLVMRPADGDVFYAGIDGFAGCRTVVRFNDFYNSWVEMHGTESGGAARGSRSLMVHNNNFFCTIVPNTGCHSIVNNRSGQGISFSNTATGYPQAPNAITLDNQRQDEPPLFGGMADATNPLDINDAGNPFAMFEASEANSPPIGTVQSVKVAGAGWDTNEWVGYTIRKTVCNSTDLGVDSCAATVASNDDDELTYRFAHSGIALDFAMGDDFTMNKVTEVFDGACRGRGSLFPNAVFAQTYTRSGTTVTVDTFGAHGLSMGDTVIIHIDGAGGAPKSQYTGTYTVASVVDSNTFTYVTYTTPDSNLADQFNATRKVPSGWNDQNTEECYQWLNLHDSTNLMTSPNIYQISIRPNEHYFDYEPAKTFDGTIASNRSSIGVGVIASRPSTCTVNVGYWATDQGGNWNTLGGGSNDGQFSVCTTTDNWSTFITPYEYPHPLSSGEGGEGSEDTTPPTPGASGAITTANVTSTTLTLVWTKCTDDVSVEENIEYIAYRSTMDNIDTVGNAELNGTAINNYTTDIATLNVTGLVPSTLYHFNVVCRDQAGNKAAYESNSEMTLASSSTTRGLGRIQINVR